MDTNPKRRWFQFKLSTWVVLVAILAWTMALRPTAFLMLSAWPPPLVYEVGDIASGNHLYFAWRWDTSGRPNTRQYMLQFQLAPIPELTYPALALLAFFGWKLAWLVVERRRARLT